MLSLWLAPRPPLRLVKDGHPAGFLTLPSARCPLLLGEGSHGLDVFTSPSRLPALTSRVPVPISAVHWTTVSPLSSQIQQIFPQTSFPFSVWSLAIPLATRHKGSINVDSSLSSLSTSMQSPNPAQSPSGISLWHPSLPSFLTHLTLALSSDGHSSFLAGVSVSGLSII